MLFLISVLNNLISWTDNFDFADDSSLGGAEGQKGRSGKQSDKSKELGGGLKKIFSGPKKVWDYASNCKIVFLLSMKFKGNLCLFVRFLWKCF